MQSIQSFLYKYSYIFLGLLFIYTSIFYYKNLFPIRKI